MVTIARSRAIDRLRARTIAGRTIASAAEDTGGLLPVAPPSPAVETERRRDEQRVAAALGALPPAQRRTIELAYFEGLSQSEIAAKTASPLGTVKMRVKLAMAKLAELARGRKHMMHRHQMTCAQFVELADAFALDALDELEQHACARHVDPHGAPPRLPRCARGRARRGRPPGGLAPGRVAPPPALWGAIQARLGVGSSSSNAEWL